MTNNKRRLASGISTVAIAVAICVAQPAYAQSELSTIQGHVDGAKAGAQVVAVDTHTGQRLAGTTDARGNYVILGVRPSTYKVTADGQTQEADVQVGQTVTVDFAAAAPSGSGGAIVVTGRRTSQPTQAQTVATNITPAQIENLPQSQRNFLSFAALAPGISLINPSGAQQLQAGALAPQNANILLDGMSFKNPINHGGFVGQNFGGLGNPFPQIAIQEYQLQTQNFGAENGQSASALLTAITKTGGDKFHGDAFIEWQPKAFIEKGDFQTGPKQDYDRKQFGGDIGGPIIPGKLSFYFAFEGVNQKLPPGTFNNLVDVIPQNIEDEINSAIPKTFKQRLYFGKLTWFATPNDTVNLIGYKRDQSNLDDFGGDAVTEHGRFIQTNQDRYQFQWRHSQGNFLNYLNIAYDKGNQGAVNVSDGPEYILTRTTDVNSVLARLGSNNFEQNDTEKAWTARDDATYRMGQHTLKAGGQITFYKLSRIEAGNTNGTYYVLNPCDQLLPTCASFDITTADPYAGRINVNPAPGMSAKDTQIGLYISDEWKPDDHWTINAGIRWDFESNPNNKDYVTPQAIADALRAYPGWVARGIDPEDYISNGHNRKPFWGEFQPRLGVSYDLHGDRDTVIFGGAGRYYDRNLFIQGVIEQQQNANTIITTQINTPPVLGDFQSQCAGASPPAFCHDPEALRALIASLDTGGAVWVLPNKVKMPYSDQFDLGVRKRFGDITATVTYSHVESHNISMFARSNFYNNGWYTTVLTPGGCINGGDQWIIDNTPNGPFPNCSATNGQLTGFNGKLNRGINNGRARLDALFLQIEKPFTDRTVWGFTQAITLQRARSNVPMELNSDELFNAPAFGTYGWNHVNGVPKWTSVTSGIWRAPLGFILSGTLSLNSGPAFGHIVAPWNGLTGPVPEGACCFGNFGGALFPKKDIAYKKLDIRVAKTFKTPWGHEATVDFAVFNVFNWLNRTYSTWGAGAGEPPPLTENGQINNDQRQFQVGLKYKF